MNNEKKNHTMTSIQGRTKGKKDVDQVQRHELLRTTITRLKSETEVVIFAAPVDWKTVEFFFFKKSVLQGAKLILRFYPQSKPLLCLLAGARSEPVWKSELFCSQVLRGNFQ